MRIFNKKTARSLLMAGILASGGASAVEEITLSPLVASSVGPMLYCEQGATPGTRASLEFCNVLLVASAACNAEVKALLMPNLPEQNRSNFLNQVRAAQNYYANHTPGTVATCLTIIIHGFINAQVYEDNQTI